MSPLPTAADDVRDAAASPACGGAGRDRGGRGDRLVVARVDRIELSKNLLRGFQAFDDLLERRPEWRERVVFLASVYPSRTGVPAYIEYRQDEDGLVERDQRALGHPGWTPIVYDDRRRLPRSVAVLRRADVLLVNPIRDGLNLVAKEGGIVNERTPCCACPGGGGVGRGRRGGAGGPPFDVAGTADALHLAALRLPATSAARAARLRTLRGPQARPTGWPTSSPGGDPTPALLRGSALVGGHGGRATTAAGPSTTRSARASSSAGRLVAGHGHP